eukprot:TRINITY_DN2241_c1_g1_i2.p3 TRINITY_DN2241_c1_g1~~TRINITY_DN2241_c1_g1_i2.p3  ORF type:complete len:196 (+),score=14.23 TRINITY_DN2241_c1_g1_i2:60-647(+)
MTLNPGKLHASSRGKTERIGISWILFLVYAGVVLSDILSYSIGLAVKSGVFPFVTQLIYGDKEKSNDNSNNRLSKALEAVRKWGVKIGIIQRFSVGFRGPLCLAAGLSGVPFGGFAVGAAAGAIVTMAIQIFAGRLLMNSGNVYLSALALVAIPNLVGHVVGPLGTIVGLIFISRKSNKREDDGNAVLKQSLDSP